MRSFIQVVRISRKRVRPEAQRGLDVVEALWLLDKRPAAAADLAKFLEGAFDYCWGRNMVVPKVLQLRAKAFAWRAKESKK
jgi:hypothetical protein